MKPLIMLIALLVSIAACQRFVVISIPKEMNVHVQGSQVTVVDTLDNFQIYRISDAYAEFNDYNRVYQVLKKIDEPSLGLGMLHYQPTRQYQRKMNRLMKNKKAIERALVKNHH